MQARLTVNELYQLKWLTGGVLTLLSLWALRGLDLIHSGLSFVVMLGICILLLTPGWVRAVPERVWSRWVVPSILVWILVDFGLGFNNPVAPLMRMVILLLIYRTLAPHNRRREDLQMLLLCLFSIVVSGALTVSLIFAVQILLFTPIAMAFLLLVCLLDRGSETTSHQTSWVSFSLSRLVYRVWSAVELRAIVLGALLFFPGGYAINAVLCPDSAVRSGAGDSSNADGY